PLTLAVLVESPPKPLVIPAVLCRMVDARSLWRVRTASQPVFNALAQPFLGRIIRVKEFNDGCRVCHQIRQVVPPASHVSLLREMRFGSGNPTSALTHKVIYTIL